MKVETFPDGSEIITDRVTGLRTVVGVMAHREYMERLRRELNYLTHKPADQDISGVRKPVDCLTAACRDGDAGKQS